MDRDHRERVRRMTASETIQRRTGQRIRGLTQRIEAWLRSPGGAVSPGRRDPHDTGLHTCRESANAERAAAIKNMCAAFFLGHVELIGKK
jgi:hypothetical protein